jgi:hypothetical protein
MQMTEGWIGLALALTLAGCGVSRGLIAPPQAEERAMHDRGIEALVTSLYEAFCFDPGGQADWKKMEALFAKGASFVAPIQQGRAVRIVDTAGFIDDFKGWIAGSEVGRTGLHERVLRTRIERFANIAHVYVTFEGFVPGEERAQTLGVDSLQLVLDRGQWKVASFTSQYTNAELPLPELFEPGPR